MLKFLFVFFVLTNLNLQAQLPTHIDWQVSSKTIDSNKAELHFKAKLDQHWHIWSVNPGDEMLIPPSFTINTKGIKKVGNIKENGKKISKKDELYDNPINYFEGTVDFVQVVSYDKPKKIDVTIEYQICDENSCLPPTAKEVKVEILKYNSKEKKNDTTLLDTVNKLNNSTLSDSSKIVDTSKNNSTSTQIEANEIDESYGIYGLSVNNCEESKAKLSVFEAFIAGIVGGFLALFFPCTFPLIPMTMSFFLKGSKENKKKGTQNAILYGFSIFLVYFLLSLPFHFGLGVDTLNNFSTNIWINIIFFVIFIFFAFSLFGFYDISLPSSMTNEIEKKGNVGSIFGIFFMALTLAIVSFSCTGPILGVVLGSIKNANLITPAFSGFGIGLGIPFALFALFPSLLKSLPKAGGWMEVVKIVFGFIELALAFKFLSNADLVAQWGFLKREVFVIIWIVVFLLTALYLLGIFKFKSSTKIKRTFITNFLATVSIFFVLYLGSDFFGNSLDLISGFPPPKTYSFFANKNTEHKVLINDFEKAMLKAKSENKPILIDYTGWACVNCRRMEEKVWISPKVKDLMQNNYIVVSLYVDEKTPLPKEKQRYSKVLAKNLQTVGDLHTEMEVENFKQVTQPLYVAIDPNRNQILTPPKGGFMQEEEFLKFLKCGIEGMKMKN